MEENRNALTDFGG